MNETLNIMNLIYNLRVKLHILLSISFLSIAFGEVNAQNDISQQLTIVGRVSDIKKNPIHGVLVEDINGNQKATTDKNGQYSIALSSIEISLRFSHVGFEEQEIVLSSKKVINLTLKAKKTILNEVVNLHYLEVQRRHTIGALGYVDTDALGKAPVGRFEEALAGRIAGLRVNAPQGQPGDPLSLVIRGENSLHEASPLFVIDGMPIENLNSLTLNTHDIKNVTVLKDASLLALYGSRGANGVVVVETKEGYAGKSTIEFNSFFGFQDVNKNIEIMSPYDFVRYQIELDETNAKSMYTPADLPPGTPGYNAQGRILMNYKDIEGIDWQDKIFRTAPIQQYSLSIAGGDANTKFIASTSLNDQKGVVVNSGVRSYQGRIKLNQRIGRYINSGFGINYGKRPRYGQALNFEDATAVSTYSLYRMWGARPVSGSDNLNIVAPFLDPEYAIAPNIRYNPVVTLENEEKKSATSNLLSHAYLEVDFLSNLQARLQGSFISDKTNATGFYNSKTPLGSGAKGVNGNSHYNKTTYGTVDLTLSYNEVFNKVHTLDLTGGFSYNSVKAESYGYEMELLPNEDIGIYGFDEGLPVFSVSKSWKDKFSSYFINGTYNFKHKYFLTGVFRADEGYNKTFGYLPAVAIGWNMKGEDFLKSSKVISHAKLRASYGKSGVRSKNPLTQLFITTIAAPEGLMWEAVEQWDVGYDLGLRDDKLMLNLDYYDKVNSTDPGYYSMARVENKGFEVSITSLNIDQPHFKWRSNFNISFNQNRILAMRERTPIMSTVLFANTPLYIATPGEQLGAFYGYQFNGIYQEEDFDYNGSVYTLKSDVSGNGSFRPHIQPGDIRYKDINSDGFVDEEDKVVLGNSLPKYFGGFSNSLTYKAFDLNVFFQWSYGNKLFNANRMAFEGNYLQEVGLNQYASYADRWTPENRSNTLFRAGGQGRSDMLSDRTLEDGSYLRLKTVSLGYTLPKRWMSAKNLKNLRLFASAQNLLTFTNYTGLDPEVSIRHSVLTQGFDYSAYPQFRTVAIGLNATF